MDSELLKTFLEVSKKKHFGKAAESLYLTQSAVSFRIRQLEAQIGTELFTRHRNNIQLTEAGQKLMPYVEQLISLWLLAKQDILSTQQCKTIHIGTTSLLWDSVLANWLPQFYQQNQTQLLVTKEGHRNEHIDALHNRSLDILLTTELPRLDELTIEKIGEFNLALFTTDITTENEAATKFVQLNWESDLSKINKIIFKESLAPLLITNSFHTALNVVHCIHGQVILPINSAPKTLIQSQQTLPIKRDLYAVWLKQNEYKEEIEQILMSLRNLYL